MKTLEHNFKNISGVLYDLWNYERYHAHDTPQNLSQAPLHRMGGITFFKLNILPYPTVHIIKIANAFPKLILIH